MRWHRFRPTRRAVLAGMGLVVAVGAVAPLAYSAARKGMWAWRIRSTASPAAFVKIGTDDTVTVMNKHIEFGQGTSTGMATLVAEELEADWSQMRAAEAPTDDELYASLAFGVQATGGSSAMSVAYEQMRLVGAAARAMLVAAAAEEWGVSASEIIVSNGIVRHVPSGRESRFGALADRAAEQDPPLWPRLKDPKNFVLIGRDLPKLDTREKSNGTATFTADLSTDDMLVAVVEHPDHFGATVASFDDTAARAVPGVVDVRPLPQGVAVYARDTFSALKGRAALKVVWDLSKAETRSSAEIEADFVRRLDGTGLEATSRGNTEKALGADGVRRLEAQILFPFLAHAPMETLDAVFLPNAGGGIDIYSGAQFPSMDQRTATELLGLGPDNVRLHTLIAGGSFGRRAQPNAAYITEATEAFKAIGASRPMKHMWTREDDIRGGYYRPMYLHRLRGAVDATGRIVAWDQAVVGQSIAGTSELDESSVEGASNLPYAIDNLRVVAHNVVLPVPVLWWRSVGHSHTGFAVETFVDELLELGGRDAVEGRLELLSGEPRLAAVLARAAEMAGWGGPLPEGRQRGVAAVKSFGTCVAQVAEVSRGEDGAPRVHKVWCAVDCGVAVNPNVIRQQMEGGLGYGLGAILYGEITLGEGGRVMQSNFHDYRVLRINEMPEVEVAIMPSSASPSGVGEPGVPPIGPAVANAWRRLTGQPVRRLPMFPGLVA